MNLEHYFFGGKSFLTRQQFTQQICSKFFANSVILTKYHSLLSVWVVFQEYLGKTRSVLETFELQFEKIMSTVQLSLRLISETNRLIPFADNEIIFL